LDASSGERRDHGRGLLQPDGARWVGAGKRGDQIADAALEQPVARRPLDRRADAGQGNPQLVREPCLVGGEVGVEPSSTSSCSYSGAVLVTSAADVM
jgi:hypothetical protein